MRMRGGRLIGAMVMALGICGGALAQTAEKTATPPAKADAPAPKVDAPAAKADAAAAAASAGAQKTTPVMTAAAKDLPAIYAVTLFIAILGTIVALFPILAFISK